MNGNSVTKERIDYLLSLCKPRYAIIPATTMTVCVLQLPNGFTVGKGESACVDPDNFNKHTGEKYALENALVNAENELWRLEGYKLAMELNPL